MGGPDTHRHLFCDHSFGGGKVIYVAARYFLIVLINSNAADKALFARLFGFAYNDTLRLEGPYSHKSEIDFNFLQGLLHNTKYGLYLCAVLLTCEYR